MTEFVRILKKKELLPKVVPFYYGGSQPGAQPPEALPQLPGKKPKKFLPALKYNHEHDELGRFATSGGGTGAMREMFGRVSQPDGGFTYQPTSHEEPKEGFAVSPYPERSFAVDEKDFTFKSLVDYVTKNRDMFEQPDHFVGAWHDPESHQIFLDVSVVSKDAAAAETLAKNHDQIAYFDLKAGKSVTVNREATSGGVVKGIRDGRRKNTEATNTAFDAWQESDGLKSFSDFVRKFNWAQTNRARVKRSASLTGFAQILKYSPDQPRDENGRWTTGGAAGDLSQGEMEGTQGHHQWTPVYSVEEAYDLLTKDQKVILAKPSMVSTLLDKLADEANKARTMGKRLTINLCNVMVEGTNVFCAENKGISRVQMPQLSGKPEPGSKADLLPKNDKGEVNLGELFREHLTAKGIEIKDESVPSSYLKASQNELAGDKVAGIMKAIEAGKIKDARLFVSHDDYVVDGHHRWAAKVGVDQRSDVDLDTPMPVARIQMGIMEVLVEANKFALDMGIKQAKM